MKRATLTSVLLLVAACAGTQQGQSSTTAAGQLASAAGTGTGGTAATTTGGTATPAPVADLVFPEEDYRKTQPTAGPVRPLSTPKVERFTMKNGTDVYLVEQHDLPTVSMQLVVDSGSVADPNGKEGMASMCVDLMTEGTEKLDKLAFEEALADLASRIGSFAGDDQQGVSMTTLSRNLDATLDLFADTLLHPGMRQADLDRAVKRRHAALLQAKGAPGSIAGRVRGSLVYGEKHPLGRVPTDKSTDAIKLPDCKAYIASTMKPGGARLFVVGDITRAQIEEKLGSRLAAWKGKAPSYARIARPAPRKGKIFFVDVPNAPQSVVSLVHPGPERTAKDYYATDLMSTILGGGFSSRINMNIREKHGYAYGARGGFAYKRAGSVFSADASVRSDVTKESIVEILREIRGLRDGEVTDVELDREKNGAILGLPAQWATGRAVLSAFQSLVYFGLPLNYYETFIPNVQSVTKGSIRKAAMTHLRPAEARILVVGDGKSVLPKLRELAADKEIGPGDLVTIDADGVVVK